MFPKIEHYFECEIKQALAADFAGEWPLLIVAWASR
jgi:hypothetical protein